MTLVGAFASVPLVAQTYSSQPVTGGSGDVNEFGMANRSSFVGARGDLPSTRGFYVFDLNPIEAGATLQLGSLGWSVQISSDFQLRAYAGDPSELLVDGSEAAKFLSLGAGSLLASSPGSFISPALEVSLTSDALDALTLALNTPSKLFAFSITTPWVAYFYQLPTLYLEWAPGVPMEGVSGGSGASAASVAAANRQQVAHRQMQAQQAAARRVAAQQRAAQHRRNQQR